MTTNIEKVLRENVKELSCIFFRVGQPSQLSEWIILYAPDEGLSVFNDMKNQPHKVPEGGFIIRVNVPDEEFTYKKRYEAVAAANASIEEWANNAQTQDEEEEDS